MRRRIILLSSILMIFSMLVAGCASYPDLTEDENKMVEEYAASLLLKYDSENHTRLVDTSSYLNQYNTALALREESIKQYEEALQEQEKIEEEKRNEPNFSQTDSKEPPVDNDGYGGAEIINEPSVSLEEYLGLDGFSISYAGNTICKSYPEDSATAIRASSGKDLLIVIFAVSSSNGGTLDIFHKNASFKASVNGGSYITNNMTILENDLSQFMGNINAGSSTNLILAFEVKEGTTVSSLNLSANLPGQNSIESTLVR